MATAEESLSEVDTLLKKAGRSRSQWAADHVVELQLVVEALKQLPDGTYRSEDWQRRLVDFFNDKPNMQLLTRNENRNKQTAVGKFIKGEPLNKEQRVWIQKIRDKWRKIQQQLTGFDKFINSLDKILARRCLNLD